MAANPPHGAAVEVDHHPLVGVHVEALRPLHATHQRPELRADEGAARVARVHVQPRAQLLGDKEQLFMKSLNNSF